MSEGLKDDKQKPRWSLLPKGTVSQVVDVLEFGAKKYAPNNWMLVERHRQRYYDAIVRHLEAWWKGEQKDPDSGLHHLAHVACSALFLLWFDDQPEKHLDLSAFTKEELTTPIDDLIRNTRKRLKQGRIRNA